MKTKNLFRCIAATLMAGALLTSALTVSAFATHATSNQFTFTKTLDMTQAVGASVPDETFTYTIAAGTAVAATATNPAIEAGVGAPVVSSAVFAHTDTAADQVTKNVSVDFGAVVFPHAGIYRYKVTEAATANADITNDATADRYLDVYVENAASGLAITHYVFLSSAEIPSKAGVYTTATKSAGYTNTYETYAMTLSKTITGAMANMSEKFNFTIDFNGPANASFQYGATTITLDATGHSSFANVQLGNGDTALVQGIPSTVTYTVTENIDANEGYTTTYKVNAAATATTGTATAEQTMGKANNTVDFTNNKDAASPTGIIMSIAPYVLMVALAGVFAFIFFRKKNHVAE